MDIRNKTLSPKKSGEIYGKLIPSHLGAIKYENGKVLRMNRRDRRAYLK